MKIYTFKKAEHFKTKIYFVQKNMKVYVNWQSGTFQSSNDFRKKHDSLVISALLI